MKNLLKSKFLLGASLVTMLGLTNPVMASSKDAGEIRENFEERELSHAYPFSGEAYNHVGQELLDLANNLQKVANQKLLDDVERNKSLIAVVTESATAQQKSVKLGTEQQENQIIELLMQVNKSAQAYREAEQKMLQQISALEKKNETLKVEMGENNEKASKAYNELKIAKERDLREVSERNERTFTELKEAKDSELNSLKMTHSRIQQEAKRQFLELNEKHDKAMQMISDMEAQRTASAHLMLEAKELKDIREAKLAENVKELDKAKAKLQTAQEKNEELTANNGTLTEKLKESQEAYTKFRQLIESAIKKDDLMEGGLDRGNLEEFKARLAAVISVLKS